MPSVIRIAFAATGATLSFYVGAAAMGWVRSGAEYYTNFGLAIVVMASLLAMRNLSIANTTPLRQWRGRLTTTTAAILAISGASYIRWHVERLEIIRPFYEPLDVQVGLLFAVGVILLTSLHWGWVITSAVVAALLYFFYGHLADNYLFNHPEYEVSFVMNYISLSPTEGLFRFVQLAADGLYFMLIFASLLVGIGVLKLVVEVGRAGGRQLPGGAALPALVSSGVIASVMGQAVSNVMLTGRFTIPMMKQSGYTPSMAGAIEAVASVSGQLVPPILGLAGFIMAAFLGVAYVDIAAASIIPAILFLGTLTLSVFAYARRHQIPKLTEPIDVHAIRRIGPTFLAAFGVVVGLLMLHYSPSIAGSGGAITALLLCVFQGPYRPSLASIGKALEEGFELITLLCLLVIAIGPVAQVMITTNLSGRLGGALIQWLPDSPVLMLLGVALVSLILGMGLPTPVAYVVVSLALVPFMQQIGIDQLAAHFFVLYFAVFSSLTLPVAVAVLAASKLSGASFMTTSMDAMRLAFPAFLVPFVFAFQTDLLNIDLSWITPIIVIVTLLLTSSLIAVLMGYRRRVLRGWERAALSVIVLVGLAGLLQTPLDSSLLEVFVIGFMAFELWTHLTRKTAQA